MCILYYQINESHIVDPKNNVQFLHGYTKPKEMPILKEGQSIICVYDRKWGDDQDVKLFFVCEQLCDMQRLWNLYTKGKSINWLKWYIGNVNNDVLPEKKAALPEKKNTKKGFIKDWVLEREVGELLQVAQNNPDACLKACENGASLEDLLSIQ